MLTDIPANPLNPTLHWPRTTKYGKRNKQQASAPHQSPSESQRRSSFLGVETLVELVWERWELGGEFTKTLYLKNVHGKLQRLRFRPPASKAFTTLFPKVITLSPGTSFSMPVTFRPLERCEYQDTIEFQSKEGTFQVSLRATIPRHSLELPEQVQLPACAAHHSTQTTFTLHNPSKLRTGFSWEVDGPFQLSPESGVLAPGEGAQVTALFRPLEARVYQTEARCAFGDQGENSCSMLLQGLSKYPYLEIRSPGGEEGCKLLEFGTVAFGSSQEKHFEIFNPSPVTSSFSLSRLQRPALLDSVFECSVCEGLLTPGSSVQVPVCFSPVAVDSSSVEYLCLSSPGALSKQLVKLTGSCCGPLMSLSASVLDFGCVAEDGRATRVLQLTNSSAVEGHYQFDVGVDGHSVFSVEPPRGTVAPNTSLSVQLHFCPRHPIPHRRRLACLVLHREPLFLDVIGTCHSEQLKPLVLRPRHLSLYLQHLRRGLTVYPPDILSAMLAQKTLQLDQDGVLNMPQDLSQEVVPSDPLMPMTPMDEYFLVETAVSVKRPPRGAPHPGCHVSVEPPELLFYEAPHSRSLTLTNHTKGKLCLLWTPGGPDSPFSVAPETCELGPLKTTDFRVTYCPRQANTVHAAQLECFAVYKVLRDYRLTEEVTLCPPWCVTVRVSGHSFQPGREPFLPRCSLTSPHVVFPALPEVSYRTVLLQNTGDLPLLFRLGCEECPAVSVLPSSGLVPPGSHQVLCLRSTPSEERTDALTLPVHLNASPKHTQELTVVSVAERPRVCVEGDGCVFFKPTAVGCVSERAVRMRNMSRLPLHYQWRTRASHANVLSVEPSTGTLQPNESTVQNWRFSPQEEMTYSMKPSLLLWPTQSQSPTRRSRLFLQAVGVASKGSIEAGSAVVDLGELLAGGCKSFEVPLVNNGSCPLSFSISVQQSVTDPSSAEEAYDDPSALELDVQSGVVPARSRVLLRCTVTLPRRALYCWDLSYHTLNAHGCAMGDAQPLCLVRGQGVFPMLQVTDARGSGAAEGLSKLQLWSLLSLEPLNTCLRRHPSPLELTHRVPTRHSLRHCPSVFTSSMLDFNFGAAPVGSEASCILLLFENTGSVPVQWSFLLPEDQQIELEYWAESGDFTPTELHLMRVQDNRLFSISPRSGSLPPGQQRAVQFTYRHEFAGTDRLPVLLKLSYGREILLNFLGVTVERDQHYLHFTSSTHTLAPVVIGGFNPPKQVYELYNGGALPLRYHVDTEPLEQLTADNFGHPVLQCLTPYGEVLPGRSACTEWIFSPLEAKTYSVDIPIHVLEGDSVLIQFEGSGFDSRDLGMSAPFRLDPHLVPCTQRVPLPGQIVFLSQERVCLGDVPVCSRSTRLIFITNVSNTERVLYTWNLTDKDREVVEIHPEHGSLAADESALCILTLHTSGSPCFYQLDLTCEVLCESAVLQHQAAVMQWEQEKEREEMEFTLTEKDLRSTDPSHDTGISDLKSSSTLRKYKTLPPIRVISSGVLAGGPYEAKASRAERRAQREASKVGERPAPPRPAQLHLGLSARSHSLDEYQTFFPTLFNTHHVHSLEQPRTPPSELSEVRPPSVNLPLLTQGPEREILTHTLTSIIRSLLDDPQFHESVLNDRDEPVPYFTQLHPLPPSPPPPRDPSPALWRPPARCAMRDEGSEVTDVSVPPRSPLLQWQPDPSPRVATEQAEEDSQNALRKEQQRKTEEAIRRLPEFVELVEDVLLNTLQNLMTEAFLGELVLTARPRIIALPPATPPSSHRKRSTCSRGRSAPLAPTVKDPQGLPRKTQGSDMPPAAASFNSAPPQQQ
ncbi:cilia- and flagella-associated protein 65 isoform X1 [Alosa sapidissima]|uniref:cilia- and flagella-associated protein 65 isoform X1 n=1 Tax=Alosa sapidissima TaxID=34773 RepID=UPI001C08ACD4|nr:cilia- and flagella-associated protein 65 isoform X1 [Alosa sapidissima]